ALAGGGADDSLVEEADPAVAVDRQRGVHGVGEVEQIARPGPAAVRRAADVQRLGGRRERLFAPGDVHAAVVVRVDGNVEVARAQAVLTDLAARDPLALDDTGADGPVARVGPRREGRGALGPMGGADDGPRAG